MEKEVVEEAILPQTAVYTIKKFANSYANQLIMIYLWNMTSETCNIH